MRIYSVGLDFFLIHDMTENGKVIEHFEKMLRNIKIEILVPV